MSIKAEDKPIIPTPNAIDELRDIIKKYTLGYHIESHVHNGKQKYIKFEISIKL